MNDYCRPVDSLRLHRDAERVPVPDHGDLRALRESLRENGQQDPIDVTSDGVILDGRTRWALLRELGTETIQVRVVDMPEGQQTAYMVDRARARRHLTAHQKKDLNDWMRVQVVEERPTKRGNVMRIGHSQTQRAAALGVGISTVKEWDASGQPVSADQTAPTHAIDARGRPQPLHKAQAPRAPQRGAVPRPEPIRSKGNGKLAPRPKRYAPHWGRHFTLWCRAVLPEDRPYIVQMSDELHKALALLGLSCKGEEGN